MEGFSLEPTPTGEKADGNALGFSSSQSLAQG
jgi:hypothetical protein